MAARRDIIVATGRFRPARSAQTHAHPVKLWVAGTHVEKVKEQTQRIINTLAQAARLGLGVAAETGRTDAEAAIRSALQAAARIMQQQSKGQIA